MSICSFLNKEVHLGEPTSFLDHVYLGCTQRQCEISKDVVDNYRTMFESRISAGGLEKLPFPQNLRISSWSYDIAGHAKKCVDDIGKKQNMAPMLKNLMKKKNVVLDKPTSFLDHVYLGCTQRDNKPNEIMIDEYRKMFESRISAGAIPKLLGWEKPHAKNSCVFLRHGRTCSKMRGKILRAGKQKDRPTVKSNKLLLG